MKNTFTSALFPEYQSSSDVFVEKSSLFCLPYACSLPKK